MDHSAIFTAFAGTRLLATGSQAVVTAAINAAVEQGERAMILAFDDRTGRQTDFDLRGSGVPENSRRGRPKLGVVAREVTLLPRHWEWLAEQPGGASVTLRKLVDAARQAGGSQGTIRQAQEAADRFMSAVLGNEPGYKDASRALYARDSGRFIALTEPWPRDLRDYARRLAAPAFPDVTGSRDALS